jgi:hypothetical protein
LDDRFGENQGQKDRYASSWKTNTQGRDLTVENIKFFHENPQKYEKKDINQYSDLDELDGATQIAKTKLSRKEMKAQGGEKVYEDDNFVLIHPKTHEASCKYGSRTRWCVTMRDHTGYFERYSIHGPLFFLIDKRRMPAVDSPKYMTKAPDYYKVAIHYQPRFTSQYGDRDILTRLDHASRYAGRMTKDEFVNSANIGNTKIDYWNVQDKNVSEGTFLRYIGGPGRGQKERAEVSKNNLYTAMESYTKKILSDYYDSLGETVDNSVRIREIEVEMNTIDEERRRLSNVRSRVQDAIYYLEDVEDYMRGHTEEEGEYYSPFKDIVSREKLTELRGALNRIGERMETLDNVRREKNQEITNLQNNDGKNFAFYDLSTTS